MHDGACSERGHTQGAARPGLQVPLPGKWAQLASSEDALQKPRAGFSPPSVPSTLGSSAGGRGGAVKGSFVSQKSQPGFQNREEGVSGYILFR